MDQTVNLTSLTSVVRIYLFPPHKRRYPYRASPFVLREKVVERTTVFAVVRASLAALIFGIRPRRGDPACGVSAICILFPPLPTTQKAIPLSGIAFCVTGKGSRKNYRIRGSSREPCGIDFWDTSPAFSCKATLCRGAPTCGVSAICILFPPPNGTPYRVPFGGGKR